jgi:hypothetical protein
MRQRFRPPACLAESTLMLVLAGCVSPFGPAVESPRLTETDIEVLRVTMESSIQPLIRPTTSKHAAVLAMATLTIPLWLAPRPSFPPPPPPSFGGARPRSPGPGAPSALDADLLTPEERTAWQLRNRLSHEIPELGLAGLVTRHEGDYSADETVVAVSPPSYPAKNSAVIYAQFSCGGTCGEGRLIRLGRGGPSWRVTASQRLWIR